MKLFPISSKRVHAKFTSKLFFFQAINESDTIMSFANRGHQEDMSHVQLFWFDTNELPDSLDEEILEAELRLYKAAAPETTGLW